MATRKQTQASKRNIRKAQRAARSKRTISRLPKSTRRELGRQAARGRARSGKAGRALEDRNRQQLYETAKKMDIPGRSRMGKGADRGDPPQALTFVPRLRACASSP